MDEAMMVERASATPLAPASPAVAGVGGVGGLDGVGGGASGVQAQSPGPEDRRRGASTLPLSALEAWFLAVITHPESVAAGAEVAAADLFARAPARGAADTPTTPIRLEQLVTPGPRLTAAGRMAVYHRAYHARLVECLADDYPTLQQALGEATFEALARRYIARHPSTSPNLNGFGRRFSAFCAAEGDFLGPAQGFACDLARLEWAMVEVIHAPAAPLFSLERLREVPPERWPDIRLTPSPTLRFHTFHHPVNRYLQATRACTRPTELPDPEWSATAVYRQGFGIWRMDFTRPMAAVLEALLGAAPLGEALARLEDSGSDGAVEGDVMAWFRAWVAGGFFEALVL